MPCGYGPKSINGKSVTGGINKEEACEPCRPGYFKVEGRDRCQKCPEGTFKEEEGPGECTKCPAGYGPINPFGKSVTGGKSKDEACEPCRPGYFKAEDFKAEDGDRCKACPEYQYTDKHGQQGCQACEYMDKLANKPCEGCYWRPPMQGNQQMPPLNNRIEPIQPPPSYAAESAGEACYSCPFVRGKPGWLVQRTTSQWECRSHG